MNDKTTKSHLQNSYTKGKKFEISKLINQLEINKKLKDDSKPTTTSNSGLVVDLNSLIKISKPAATTLNNHTALNNPQNAYFTQTTLSNSNLMNDSQMVFNVRFAVNGLSKFSPGNNVPEINKSIQAGDFGDDAGMIAENSQCVYIGLADGAGGNRSNGIDPSKFSRGLLANCVEVLKKNEVKPDELAKLVCKSVHILEKHNIEGSGTVCILSIDKDTNVMHTLNMGDSGFRLIRQGRIVGKSKNTMAGSSPKQLYVSYQYNYSGLSFVNEGDIASDSDLRTFHLQKGDLLVLGSDGIYDVVTDARIEECINKRDPKDLQGIADDLVQKSMGSYTHTKRDDILIMVCRIEIV